MEYDELFINVFFITKLVKFTLKIFPKFSLFLCPKKSPKTNYYLLGIYIFLGVSKWFSQICQLFIWLNTTTHTNKAIFLIFSFWIYVNSIMELPYSIISRFIYVKEFFWHTFIKDHPKFLKVTYFSFMLESVIIIPLVIE